MQITVLGFETHEWRSVERTRAFFARTLDSQFSLASEVGKTSNKVEPPDLILNFSGSRGWQHQEHPPCPLVMVLHGGTVLNTQFLSEHLAHLQTTDLLITNCSSDMSILRSIANPAPRICILPLPFMPDVFYTGSDAAVRVDLGLGQCSFVLGFVARLIPHKNLHVFLDLVATMRAQMEPEPIGAIVIGDFYCEYPVLNFTGSSYPAFIRRMLKDHALEESVAFLPSTMSDSDLGRCYRAMDVLVHPTHSIDENYGYVPIEAMACGVPVIGSAYGGLKDTIKHGETGFLVPTWCTRNGIRMHNESFLASMHTLLSSESLREHMSATAASHALMNYSEASCADILTAALSETVYSNRRRTWSEPCRAKPLPLCDESSDLPTLTDSWQRYRPAVEHYVSSGLPQLNNHTVVSLAARVSHKGPVTCLEDPAWPAACHLSSLQKSIVEECQSPITCADLEQRVEARFADIITLLRLGILTARHERQ